MLEHFVTDEVEGDEETTDLSVAIQKRMDRLKLVVTDGDADQVRHFDLIVVPGCFEIAHETRSGVSCSPRTPLRRVGGLHVGVGSRAADGQRIYGLEHGRDVVPYFLPVVPLLRINCIRIVLHGFLPSSLRTFYSAGDLGFINYVHLDKVAYI